MSAQLTEDPIIKLTLTNDETYDKAPLDGYVCDKFRLTKGLLQPNKFEFVLRQEILSLETPDIYFDLRDKLLAAKVEVNLKGRREENEEMIEYEVEDFFYGYIQNVQVYRSNGGPVKFKCTAYSPDARLKHHPANRTFVDANLAVILGVVTSHNLKEGFVNFDKKEGKYDNEGIDNCLKTEFNFAHDASNCNTIPYTVQYKESPYNFLKRMARRHGEFMYYENRTFIFGAMHELPEIHMKTGIDLDSYTYEMNMNDHCGISFTKFDTFRGKVGSYGRQKRTENSTNLRLDSFDLTEDDLQNDMAKSAYQISNNFFSDHYNSIYELGAQPLIDEDITKVDDQNQNKLWYQYQREFLERYILSDSLICYGKADRLDLKLGSIIVIEDETKTGSEIEETIEHSPLKVIELSYIWEKDKDNLGVRNRFKAIPKGTSVPPYLERDKDGFLVYGDFDSYPVSGPQYGVVVDNRDPEHLGRVKVCLTWQGAFFYLHESDNYKDWSYLKEEDNRTPWIWMVSPYQGDDHGMLAIPEIGDLVLVGFEHNNIERPYVMGSRYSKLFPMNSEWSQFEKNNVKGFRSRSGHTIEIIDKDGDIKDNSGYNTGGRIHIYDARTHAYDITFDTDKKLIRMESKGNIELTANKDIVLHAHNDISLTADNDITLTAKNDIDLEADNDISETAENDIYREAKNDTWDHEGHDYINKVNNDLNVYMENLPETHIHMIEDRIQLQVNASKCVLRMEEDRGAILQAEKDVRIYGKQKALIKGDQEAAMGSDMKAGIKGKTVKVESDMDISINGKIVKIN